jgi:lipopolysaccharide export LptBFGC system permease protein LptF
VTKLWNYPLLIFVITFFLLWLAAWAGARRSQMRRALADEDVRDDFGVVQAATLTLLGLIIGFSFSMATGRYDQRKNYEEAEANAIGTEYLRAELLSAPDAAKVKALLRQYTEMRMRWYTTRNWEGVTALNTETEAMQNQLWAAVSRAASAQPSAVVALVLAGMNDVLNSQGYTQAAWWNRIPVGAWCLMFAIALFCNWLVGYGLRRIETKLLVILPLVVAVSFFLIADIDSPRGGVIRVHPQNLESLRAGLHAE